MRTSFFLMLFAMATSLSAQFMSTLPFTGGGNNALKQLRPGSTLPRDYTWQPGVDQKDWATSTLMADVDAPRPRFPGTSDPDQGHSDDLAYMYWSEMYSARQLSDGKLETAWVEGASGPGVGEVVLFPVGSVDNYSGTLTIRNGFQKNRNLFLANGRVKDFRATLLLAGALAGQFSYGFTEMKVVRQQSFVLADSMEPQVFRFGSVSYPPSLAQGLYGRLVYVVAIEILSVHAGSRYPDTCISEVEEAVDWIENF